MPKQLRLHRATVRKYLRAPVVPAPAQHPTQPSILDPYVGYLTSQWAMGRRTATHLYRAIQAQGYPGRYRHVARWVAAHHRVSAEADGAAGALANPSVPISRLPLPSPSQVAWLLVRRPTELLPTETTMLQHMVQHPVITEAYQLAQRFQTMVRRREVAELDPWLDANETCAIAELRTFATGLRQEYASIAAAVREPWSTGQVEGQITRLKYLKRQMYGRATFDVLRIRVLSG